MVAIEKKNDDKKANDKAEDKTESTTDLTAEQKRNRAAQRAASTSIIGSDGSLPVERSGLSSVSNAVLNPAFVIMEGE